MMKGKIENVEKASLMQLVDDFYMQYLDPAVDPLFGNRMDMNVVLEKDKLTVEVVPKK